MLPQYLTLISIPLGLVGSILYIRDMYRGTAKPNRVSFFLWSLAPIIGVAIAFGEGVRWSLVPIFMAGFSPLLVFVFSFVVKQGFWKLQKLDYVCGFFSVVALFLWLVMDVPILAFVFAVAADLFASIPTILKAWKHPESESPFIYLLPLVGHITNLLVITTWAVTYYGFSIYIIAANTSILFGIYQYKLFHKKADSV